MRVLVTGATGFIGAHLTALLKKEGHGVIDGIGAPDYHHKMEGRSVANQAGVE